MLLISIQSRVPSFEFSQAFFENPPTQNINLLGFYQSEKWFAHASALVRKEFTFKQQYREIAEEMRKHLSGEVISLHIRRTDYVNNANHDCVGLDAQELFPDDRFFVSETNCPYTDMCLMTLCDYHIVANSSYSWWGAWLSNSKKVITPKTWFGPGLNHNTKDIYCDGWVIV